MKITFVSDTYAPQLNGVANTLQRLVYGLKERGNQVDVIRPAVLACDEEGLKVPSVALPGYPGVHLGLPMRRALQGRWRRNRPDVVYAATEAPLGASAISAARALKIPVVSGFHTNFQQYLAHYKLPMLERTMMKYLRRIHNRSHITFAPSRDAIECLNEAGFRNLELLPKGVDTQLFSPGRRDPLLREEWGATDADSLVGVYVGRIAAEKNLPLIVRAFTEIRRRHSDFRGVFVGDGPKLADLKREHPEFIYAGWRYGEDLARHYASADLFVFPSATETFGNVTLEAMASGLGVAAFDYAAARQHIEHEINGYVAPFGDEETFVETALAAANDLQFSNIRGRARRSAEQARWSNVVEPFETTLNNLIDRQAPVTGRSAIRTRKPEFSKPAGAYA